MEELTISQIARHAAIRPSTIRYYESINLLPPAPRTSGQRRYDPSILHRLSFIKTAQSLGFSLTEIQAFFENSAEQVPISTQWQMLAQHKLAEVDALINRAYHMKRMLQQSLNCNCPTLDDCIDCVLANYTPLE
jgi:MerR family transcriptional regulator, redox-sensitive transcriptional activator SoxR